jgi:hypothetical protein
MGGRKKGTRNLITREHKMALREAVDRVESDDAGKDGAFGYGRGADPFRTRAAARSQCWLSQIHGTRDLEPVLIAEPR